MLFQSEAGECSLACLAMIAGYYGSRVTLGDIRKRHPISLTGASLRTTLQISAEMQLDARPLRCEVADLQKLRLPAMLHWNLDHFVVLRDIRFGKYTIHDPAFGVRTCSESELSDHFSGIVVEAHPSAPLSAGPPSARLTLWRLLGNPRGLKSIVGLVLFTSALLELLLLGQPMFIRAAVDTGMANADRRFIAGLIAILIATSVFQGAISVLRDYAVLSGSTSLNMHMATRLLRHTLGLPLPFFEKRSVGQLIERYRAADEVERYLVSSLPLGLIDGVMTMISVGMLSFLSYRLGLLSVVTIGVYYCIRIVSHKRARAREESLVWLKGQENGHRIETLRSVFTVKASALEEHRYFSWLNHYGRLVDAQKKLGVIDIGHRGLRYALMGVNVAVLLWLEQSHTSAFSMGTLLALLFYNTHFLQRSTLLVERIFDFKLLSVRLDRLEDIVFSEPEEPVADGQRPLRARALPGIDLLRPACGGAIRIEGLSFRYSPHDRAVIDELSCEVSPGELIAVVGDNGAGKTTLMKLLLGLYRPQGGRIELDGVDSTQLSLVSLRKRIGVVTQDDQLLTGSIAQNIASFDPQLDFERVARAAERACVRADIERLPMRYDTRVGDLGCVLSEGQRQKLFLARALYADPSIILMDEGTANLDQKSESAILENLAALPATKILIAHRSATIRRADRVLVLKDGRLSEALRAAPAPEPESAAVILKART